MRLRPSLLLPVICLLLAEASCLTPSEYEEMADKALRSGNYLLAAENYDSAAEAYAQTGNYSAAAINHRRAASVYYALGSTDEYVDQTQKAATAYARYGQILMDDGYYLSAAGAFENSAALYNATNRTTEFLNMQRKAGDTYLLSASTSTNLTVQLESFFGACAVFHPISEADFNESRGRLVTAVERAKAQAVKRDDPSIFDLLDLYYLPVYSQIMADGLASGEKMLEVGDLAMNMSIPSFAASYYVTAAIFFDEEGEDQLTDDALLATAGADKEVIDSYPVWNYTAYVSTKSYFEDALYIYNHLGMRGEAERIAGEIEGALEGLATDLEETAVELSQAEDLKGAAGNYSAAAEIWYVMGDDDEFRRLNRVAGEIYRSLGEESLEAGEMPLAARQYEEAGFLLRLSGDGYAQPYERAADIYSEIGSAQAAAGNLSTAASYLRRAADDYRIAGSVDPASEAYNSLILVLEDLVEQNPESRGLLLVSIADARYRMGLRDAAKETYGEASDELVQIVSSYLQSSPTSLASYPSLTKGLVKAYRMSDSLYLARRIVETLDLPYLRGTTSILATFAQNYRTASSIYLEISMDDLSVFDFGGYAVNQLFCGITSLMASDLERSRACLSEFEELSHDLHSSNRKFHELLSAALEWRETGTEEHRQQALANLNEIRTITDETDMRFMLEDLNALLENEHSLEVLESKCSSSVEAGNWSQAARLYRELGLMTYFSEEYDDAQSAFEDSSFYHLKSAEYSRAWDSAKRAYECTFSPSDYVMGLRSLSKGLMEANQTLARSARQSFEASTEAGYKEEKCEEMISMAKEIIGLDWAPVMLRFAALALALLGVLGLLLFIRRRKGEPGRES